MTLTACPHCGAINEAESATDAARRAYRMGDITPLGLRLIEALDSKGTGYVASKVIAERVWAGAQGGGPTSVNVSVNLLVKRLMGRLPGWRIVARHGRYGGYRLERDQ